MNPACEWCGQLIDRSVRPQARFCSRAHHRAARLATPTGRAIRQMQQYRTRRRRVPDLDARTTRQVQLRILRATLALTRTLVRLETRAWKRRAARAVFEKRWGDRHCEYCGTELVVDIAFGTPPRFCSREHRLAVYRRTDTYRAGRRRQHSRWRQSETARLGRRRRARTKRLRKLQTEEGRIQARLSSRRRRRRRLKRQQLQGEVK